MYATVILTTKMPNALASWTSVKVSSKMNTSTKNAMTTYVYPNMLTKPEESD